MGIFFTLYGYILLAVYVITGKSPLTPCSLLVYVLSKTTMKNRTNDNISENSAFMKKYIETTAVYLTYLIFVSS